jgi:hypothetical protein
LIVLSGVPTAGVALSSPLVGGHDLELWSSAPVVGVLVIAWQAFANLVQINSDILPRLSPADVGCLVAGAIAPLLVAVRSPNLHMRWLPAMAGGFVGFVVNVAVL